jgi:hypothetical protein
MTDKRREGTVPVVFYILLGWGNRKGVGDKKKE